MAEDFQEKTEQATPRKKQQARDKGQVAKSQDLVAVASTGGILLIFYFAGGYFFENMTNMTRDLLGMQHGGNPMDVSKMAVVYFLKLTLPFLFAAVVMVTFASVAQGGFVFKPMEFEFEKVNPINGISKLFSMQGMTQLLKSILKFAVGSWVVYYVIKKDLKVLPSLAAMEMGPLVKTSGRMILSAAGIAFLYYFVVAFVGYLFDRWQHERSLRMTKEEVREEMKESEGDPKIKSRIRSIQREMARKRMIQEVPTATVVITNPTHFAVALKYEEGKMAAPKIIAKGAGVIALKIKEIAAEHGVPIVEDKPLARALFKLDIGTFIPEEFYVAVAKVLAYIYKLKGKV